MAVRNFHKFTETFLYLLSNEASFQKIFIDRNNFYINF